MPRIRDRPKTLKMNGNVYYAGSRRRKMCTQEVLREGKIKMDIGLPSVFAGYRPSRANELVECEFEEYGDRKENKEIPYASVTELLLKKARHIVDDKVVCEDEFCHRILVPLADFKEMKRIEEDVIEEAEDDERIIEHEKIAKRMIAARKAGAAAKVTMTKLDEKQLKKVLKEELIEDEMLVERTQREEEIKKVKKKRKKIENIAKEKSTLKKCSHSRGEEIAQSSAMFTTNDSVESDEYTIKTRGGDSVSTVTASCC
ncbi:hypothetical protein AB6A40_004840 [Gnathostoma spinigerum]|uniref:Uncharacterized protein n=1 Tax=Gnathostoma spinigerum TaxID=75299 RepID=A0ABD6EL42_9BILA